MKHRKQEHTEFVGQCIKYKEDKCKFNSQSCFFKHGVQDDNKNPTTVEMKESEENDDSQSIFCQASRNLKPPLKK